LYRFSSVLKCTLKKILSYCITQEEGSLSSLRLLLCTGRNASLDPPLGLHRKRTGFLFYAFFSAEAGMLPVTRLWAYTGRGQPFCFNLASLQRQECFPGLASGLTQEEDSLSASSLLLFRGRNAFLDSPLGLHRKTTAFLLHACFSAKAGMLSGTRHWAYTGRKQPFCSKPASLQRQNASRDSSLGLHRKRDNLSASYSTETIIVVCEASLGLHRKRNSLSASYSPETGNVVCEASL
jgi:hypothetical protein